VAATAPISLAGLGKSESSQEAAVVAKRHGREASQQLQLAITKRGRSQDRRNNTLTSSNIQGILLLLLLLLLLRREANPTLDPTASSPGTQATIAEAVAKTVATRRAEKGL
jgi:hypothetical protein